LHESAAISSNFHGDPPAAATPQAVVDRRELAFIAVERTHMPMVMTDMRQPDAPIVMANTAFLNLTGYDADEVVGRNCRFLQGPDTSALAIAELRTAIDQGQEITTTLLNHRKDGESFWNELHLSPIRDDAGEVIYVFGSQRDVSDRRRAQILAASEHRLLREVDHRAMNVLALVNGIVRLSNADNAARYAASVQHRVDSLARAHRLLAEQGWRSLLLSEIFASQLEPFGASRIALVGAALRAPAIVVQPLSLVVHELLSNAVTHGALSQSDGRVEVRWRHVEANLVEIVWEEHGAALDKSMGPAGLDSRRSKASLNVSCAGDCNAHGRAVASPPPCSCRSRRPERSRRRLRKAGRRRSRVELDPRRRMSPACQRLQKGKRMLCADWL
jgi:PAS domain S-box-containing protein